MSPTEIQAFIARRRAAHVPRAFTEGYIDLASGQMHHPDSRTEVGILLHLAIAANDLDAVRFYMDEAKRMMEDAS